MRSNAMIYLIEQKARDQLVNCSINGAVIMRQLKFPNEDEVFDEKPVFDLYPAKNSTFKHGRNIKNRYCWCSHSHGHRYVMFFPVLL
jgi:hypothetical protein